MPELPEVETVAQTLATVLVGKRIRSLDIFWPRTLAAPDPVSAQTRLQNAEILAVSRRAKLITFRLSSTDTLTMHLRMTGELLFRPDANEPRAPEREKHLRAEFSFSDDSDLLYYDPRKFGRITLLSQSEYDALDHELGVEPLRTSFTTAALEYLLAGRKRHIKTLLLDQHVIAGLGNIYVDETLFQAGIHPLTHAEDIPAQKIERLHDIIVDTLQEAITLRGTTLRNYRTGFGDTGRNQQRLRIYGKAPGTPCPVCGTPLQRLVVSQRGTICCPHCQLLE